MKNLGLHIILLLSLCFILQSCTNIFAPTVDDTTPTSLLTDQKTVEGLFQNFRYAYTFKDTTVYGELLAYDFTFNYRDYEQGHDVTWDRATEMRTTDGLFRNSQKTEIVWNNIVYQAGDSLTQSVKRGFNLTITFNPSDVIRLNGFVDLNLTRPTPNDKWKIKLWRDESF